MRKQVRPAAEQMPDTSRHPSAPAQTRIVVPGAHSMVSLLGSRDEFLSRVSETEARFAEGPVARPPHWTGFRLAPAAIEFWLDRPFRLHERRRFVRSLDGGWTSSLLYP